MQDWHGLDTALAKVLSEHADSPLLGSHPVYQYLAARYVLNARAVHWEPG